MGLARSSKTVLTVRRGEVLDLDIVRCEGGAAAFNLNAGVILFIFDVYLFPCLYSEIIADPYKYF